MDWINEKIEQLQRKIKNMPLKQSMIAYLLFGVLICFICTWVTETLCSRWIGLEYTGFGADKKIRMLDAIRRNSSYFYMAVTSLVIGSRFYYTRLKYPAEVLQKATKEIQNNNLDFEMEYQSADEMGQLCESFDEMRRELIANKENMWNLLRENIS